MQVTKETSWATAMKSFLHHLQLEALYAETAVGERELAYPLRLRTNASDPLLPKFANHKARACLQNQSSTLSGDSRAGLLCNRKGEPRIYS